MKHNRTNAAQRERVPQQSLAGESRSISLHEPASTSHVATNGHAVRAVLPYAELRIRGCLSNFTGNGSLQRPSARYLRAKRFVDLTIGIPAVVLLAPIMALIIVLIRLDSSGPAIFRQNRVGANGRVFEMLKFRTMTHGSDLLNGPDHKTEFDHRVTRVGRFLRRTSLDEVPQLINVIRGEMSLVGPRPEIVEIMLEKYEPWQYQRLTVPQGITGWWQVTGRGRKPLFKHTHDDLYYIEHASLLFDLKIMLMTIQAVIRRDGAF